jgi:O-antigen ligase
VGKFNIETVILFLAFFCLVMTFSITGYIALIFLIVIWLFVFLKQKRFYGVALKLVSASLLLLIVAAPYLSGFFQRTTNISSIKNYDFLSVFQSEESYLVRSTGWMVGLKEIFERPLLGIGFRNTMFYYKDLVPKWAMANGVVQTYADPSYLDLVPTPKGFFPGILGETGLIGLTLFLILYIASLIKIIQLKPKEPSEKVIKYSILFSLFSIIPLGLSLDFTYPYFWLILGLSSSIIEADRRGLKRG